jgi:lysozyme
MPPNALDIAIAFIKQWEGCKLTAYIDQGGRVTIGWGSTGGVQLGETWSQQEADEFLLEDVTEALQHVKDLVKVPLTNNQLAALTSFAYNLGATNLARSGLLKFLNQSNPTKAADQFPLWCHIGLYQSPGLLARRQAERALFLKDLNAI